MATIPIYNPVTPFLGQIPGGLRPSLMVRVKGKVAANGRCIIDFVNSPALNVSQDIMLHISIRPKDKMIVRNSFQNGKWLGEERYGLCHVRKNETFEMIILAEWQHYKISVNGLHLGVFRHRIPLNLVNFIHVAGEVTVDHILLEQDHQSHLAQTMIPTFVAMPAPSYAPVQMQLNAPTQPPPYHQQQPPAYVAQEPLNHNWNMKPEKQ